MSTVGVCFVRTEGKETELAMGGFFVQTSAGPVSPFIFTKQQNVICTFNLGPFNVKKKKQGDP